MCSQPSLIYLNIGKQLTAKLMIREPVLTSKVDDKIMLLMFFVSFQTPD